jgi:hypothetical protein
MGILTSLKIITKEKNMKIKMVKNGLRNFLISLKGKKKKKENVVYVNGRQLI